MIPEMQTEIHEILYGTSYPLPQLWGVRQVNDSTTQEEETNNRQMDINQIEQAIQSGAADLTKCITDLSAMRIKSEESKRNYELALQSGLNTLEIAKYQLLLKQEDINLAEIQRVTELAEIARKEKTTKYLVWGGVAVAGIVTVGLFLSNRKK